MNKYLISIMFTQRKTRMPAPYPVRAKHYSDHCPLAERCKMCREVGILRCTCCKSVRYCSRDCQVFHWPVHKDDCKLWVPEVPKEPKPDGDLEFVQIPTEAKPDEETKFFVSTRRRGGKTKQVVEYITEKMEKNPDLKVALYGDSHGYKLLLDPKLYDRLIIAPEAESLSNCIKCQKKIKSMEFCEHCGFNVYQDSSYVVRPDPSESVEKETSLFEDFPICRYPGCAGRLMSSKWYCNIHRCRKEGCQEAYSLFPDNRVYRMCHQHQRRFEIK
jgi:hypothetical protein